MRAECGLVNSRMKVLCATASIGLLFFVSHAGAEEPFTPPDCGVNSLYLLLRSSGHAADLKTIQDALPRRPKYGYSMLELQRAAATCGVTTTGYELSVRELPLHQPAIAHLESHHKPESGHFVLIVPVGTTGTMVQLIDPPYAPVIIDYKRILERDGKLRVLCPTSPWRNWSFALILVALFALASLATMRMLKNGQRHRARAENERQDQKPVPHRAR